MENKFDLIERNIKKYNTLHRLNSRNYCFDDNYNDKDNGHLAEFIIIVLMITIMIKTMVILLNL